MTFLNLTLPWILAGAAGLAGLLFALQQLRARHTEVAVPTTVFWAAAVRQAPVRVFRERFRHLLAYLLLLTIAMLLWLGFAGPEAVDERPGSFRILYLDGSAHTSEPAAFAAAREQLVADAASLATGSREVVFGGAYPLTLLTAGEDVAILEARLAGMAPVAAPSGVDELARLLASQANRPSQVDIVVYGLAPVGEATLAALPAGVSITRASGVSPAATSAPNRGIVALGAGDAASGAWDRVDVIVRVGASAGAAPPDAAELQFRLDGQPATHLQAQFDPGDAAADSASGRFVLQGLPANGATLEAAIPSGDAVPLDDAAWLTLPTRRVLRIAVSAAVPAPVREVIAVDPSLALVTGMHDVAVVRTDDTSGASLLGDHGATPRLEIVSSASQSAAFRIGFTGQADAQLALTDALLRLGLDQIDAQGLAMALDRPIGVEVRQAPTRSVSLWAELLDSRYNFIEGRAFPMFLSRSLRWLAHEPAELPYAAAGRAVRDRSASVALALAEPLSAFDALGAAYVPGRARAADADDGPAISLLSEAVTARSPGARLGVAAGSSGDQSTSELATWLILAALVLLALEWWLYRRNLVP